MSRASVIAAAGRNAGALIHLAEAVALNPKLGEAHYQRAGLAALAGDAAATVPSLEAAIKIDARYFERAKNDAVFDNVRAEVRLLLAQLRLRLGAYPGELREKLGLGLVRLTGALVASVGRGG